MNHSTAQTAPISIAQQERMLRNVYGTFDRNLTGWYIDKALNEVVLYQGKTKAKFRLDSEGSMHIDIPKDMFINVAGNAEINIANTLTFKATTVNSTINTTNNKGVVNNDGNVSITGNANVSQTLTAAIDCKGGGISLVGHTHNYKPGPGNDTPTSSPNAS